MLILTRKPGEAIHIGDDVTIRIMTINGSQIKIGIDAPRDVAVVREEIAGRDAPVARNTVDIRRRILRE